VGPLLSETLYRLYAYRIYPGPLSPEAERALAGFRVTIRPVSPGAVEVTVSTLRTGASQSAIYDSRYQLYFLDREQDDDRAGEETDDTDDWFLLTDAAGHIISSSGP
jgi:hypothetical protein